MCIECNCNIEKSMQIHVSNRWYWKNLNKHMNAKSIHASNLLTQYTHQNRYNCYVNQQEFLSHSSFAIPCQYSYITINICFLRKYFLQQFTKNIFNRHLLSMQKKVKIILRLYKQLKISKNHTSILHKIISHKIIHN